MLYLVVEILIYVILAGLLGVLCGWMLRGGGIRSQKSALKDLISELENKNQALFETRSQLSAARQLLKDYAGKANGADPTLAAVLAGTYRHPEESPAEAAGAAKANGAANGNGQLGRELRRIRTRRPPRPGHRRTSWSRRAQRSRSALARPG